MKSQLAHTLKSLISNLHGPLPLTPRASQQLLSQLNASFKEQFHRQHLANSPRSEDYANLHLQSILKDPLFNPKPQTPETSTSKTQHNGQSPAQLRKLTIQALDHFREQASQGKADLKMAKLCLRLQYNACRTSCAATSRQQMQASGAGSTILQWLWSSGMEDTEIFLHDQPFLAKLVPFLVAEGQQSRISRWVQRCYYSEKCPGILRQRARWLFALLVSEEIRIGDGLESATDLYLRTVADLDTDETTGTYVAWVLVKAIMQLPNSSEPQPPIFHAFSKKLTSMAPNFDLYACLAAYIHERPSPWPALSWFQYLHGLQTKIEKARFRPYIVLLGLRAAELFLEDGRQKAALWIMEFLQTNFEPELGSPEYRERREVLRPGRGHVFIRPRSMPKNQEINLQLLDTLTVH